MRGALPGLPAAYQRHHPARPVPTANRGRCLRGELLVYSFPSTPSILPLPSPISRLVIVLISSPRPASSWNFINFLHLPSLDLLFGYILVVSAVPHCVSIHIWLFALSPPSFATFSLQLVHNHDINILFQVSYIILITFLIFVLIIFISLKLNFLTVYVGHLPKCPSLFTYLSSASPPISRRVNPFLPLPRCIHSNLSLPLFPISSTTALSRASAGVRSVGRPRRGALL